MPDDPTTDTEVRTRLGALVDPVDVDAAWPALEQRFRYDRRRRSMRALAAAAAVVVVLVAAGIGVNARRSTDPSLEVADAPATTEQAPVEAAPQLQVTCDGTSGTVTPVVAARPAGVDVVHAGGSGSVLLVDPDRPIVLQEGSQVDPGVDLSAFPLEPGGEPRVTSMLRPGTYDVRCGPPEGNPVTDPAMDLSPTVSIGTVQIVDPNGYFTPNPDPSGSCDSWSTETYESDAQTPREVATWRLGPDVTFVGYRDQPDPAIVAPGLSGHSTVYYDGRSSVSLIFCPGERTPLPAGDGLAPGDTLRTEAEALAWLTTAREAGDPNARVPQSFPTPPDPVTITDQTAKLVRQDETGYESQGRSVAPGFAVWFVRVGYLGDDGIDRVVVFSFSPAGDSRTLLAYGGEPPPPGREWSAWFDALPDHAP
jgi:hypothetical protein